MKANALTPVDLFGGRVCYEVPPFQRPYVWTEEDQWQPLWDDLARVAEALLLAGDDRVAVAALASHFLGAVVVKQLPTRPVTRNDTQLSMVSSGLRLCSWFLTPRRGSWMKLI